MAKLVLRPKEGPARHFRLHPAVTTLGRSPDRDIFVSHESVSRNHARILGQGGEFELEDTGSTNGCFVNQKRIQKAVLREGDQVVLGEVVFEFSLDSTRHEDSSGIFAGLSRVVQTLTPQEEGPRPNEVQGPFSQFFQTLRERTRRWELAYQQLTVLYRISYLFRDPDRPLSEKISEALSLGMAPLRARKVVLFRYKEGEDALELAEVIAQEEATSRVDFVRAVARRSLDFDQVLAIGPQISVGPSITRPPQGETFVVAPVRTQATTFGTLVFEAGPENRDWQTAEVEFVVTLAAQIASALEQRRFLEQELETRALERELSIARKIQQNLMPEELKAPEDLVVYGVVDPMREVGGDYLTVGFQPDGRYFFVLADVSGKGIPAALGQVQIASLFRTLGRLDLKLEEIFTLVNHTLFEDHQGQLYITAFAGLYDSQDGTLEYLNAGHEWPYIFSPEGDESRLEEGDPPCGLLPGTQFHVHTKTIGPGDRVVLNTDGVVDARNLAGERFGPERLATLLRRLRATGVREMIGLIQESLARFGSGAPRSDDISLFAFERSSDP